MSNKTYRLVIGSFSIGESFEIVDLLSGNNAYMSVACFEHNNKWFVEIISDHRVAPSSIAGNLSDYRYEVLKSEETTGVNWLQKCFENFVPITVGDFYLFGPHLKNRPVPKDKIGIEIAAATAFGSGEHPTTNRCLMACQSFFDPKVHKSVLDVGCGSGVLSIAIAKLGARNVYAYDSDPEAVRVALENTINNQVEQRVSVYQNAGVEFSIRKYDFVVSNIFSGPLVSMSEPIIASMNPNAILVLSGFCSDNKSVEDKYLKSGLSLLYRYDMDNWSALVLQKPVKKRLLRAL